MIILKRNLFLIISLSVFFVFSVYLYTGLDAGYDLTSRKQEYINQLKEKIGNLEELVKGNEKTITILTKKLKNVEKATEKKEELNEKDDGGEEQLEAEENLKSQKNIDNENKQINRANRLSHIHQIEQYTKTTSSKTNICSIRLNTTVPDSELQMLDLYDSWKFENLDGGKWKQGWPITYDKEKVKNEEKLEVIVIPHSHCDPGWIMTFEEYYERQTRNILDGMARNLEKYQEMKFIYAEISFFEMWWRDQTEEIREKVKSFIKNGKLELVTGGWVMTDEANSHYHSIIVELFEGHEWIKNHLGLEAKPVSHWSIDPFGLSPTLPHLLTSANITNTVIQRVHYSVKKELALKKNLEFYWRQLFQTQKNGDMRTHVMPFYSYDIPHTCGPEPAICCQFDFRRLPEGGKSCDWGIPPEKINNRNVAKRAEMIYDQYRKKSQLFKNNVIFAPLGDDFRYDIDFEWNAQYENYQKLFEYMNNQKDWNVHARFGTLKDYFDQLDKSIEKTGNKLSTLSGDFFTYADRDDHYWSGYFTSRPFYKQLDRVLQHYLRSAEIAFTLASIEEDGVVDTEFFEKLVTARRALALFQHHDGVTGTAKNNVVLDYGKKMIDAISACEEILSECLIVLLGLDTTSKMKLEEVRENESVLPKKQIYSIGQNVVLFNTLSQKRIESICIFVNSSEASIEAEPIIRKQQISMVFNFNEVENQLSVRENVFELCFTVELDPMAAVSYKIIESTNVKKSKILTNIEHLNLQSGFIKLPLPDDLSIDNGKVKATFDPIDGMVKTVKNLIDGKSVELNAHFVNYGARSSSGRLANGNDDNPPGAYLFLPNGEANKLEKQPNKYLIIDGEVVKKVILMPNAELKVLQTYRLFNEAYYLDVETEIDITSQNDFELALRFDTNVNSGDDFFTDLNGLQMIRRKRQSKLPLQANFYPMSAGVFIEDETTRLTIHSAQALGVSSLKSRQIEIMLDRRLSRDDNRGLQQGVLDNKRTVSHLRILNEPMENGGHKENEKIGFHSVMSYLATWQLHYPILKMIGEGISKPITATNFEIPLNCDYHVVTMRTLANPTSYENAEKITKAKKTAALIMHRVVTDCRSKLRAADESLCYSQTSKIEPLKILSTLKAARTATLTAFYEGKSSENTFELEPNSVKTILIDW